MLNICTNASCGNLISLITFLIELFQNNILARKGFKIDIIKIRPYIENVTNQLHACSCHDGEIKIIRFERKYDLSRTSEKIFMRLLKFDGHVSQVNNLKISSTFNLDRMNSVFSST